MQSVSRSVLSASSNSETSALLELLVDRSEDHTVALKSIGDAISRLAHAIEGSSTVTPSKKAQNWTATVDKPRADRIMSDLNDSRSPVYVRNHSFVPS